MVIKLLMYVGLHDVYPAMEVKFAFRRKVKMTATCNFVSLGGKMREQLAEKWKRMKRKKKRGKEKRKIIDHMITALFR